MKLHQSLLKSKVILLMLMTDINPKSVNDHVRSNKLLIKKHHYLLNNLKQECGALLITAALRCVSTLRQKERIDSFKTKNYKSKPLIQTETPMSNYKVPIVNLSDYKLFEIERK